MLTSMTEALYTQTTLLIDLHFTIHLSSPPPSPPEPIHNLPSTPTPAPTTHYTTSQTHVPVSPTSTSTSRSTFTPLAWTRPTSQKFPPTTFAARVTTDTPSLFLRSIDLACLGRIRAATRYTRWAFDGHHHGNHENSRNDGGDGGEAAAAAAARGERWKDGVWRQVCEVTAELFRAAAHTSADKFTTVEKCFELFALDFLVDADANAWLLEANETPAFYQQGVAGPMAVKLMESVVCVVLEHFGRANLEDPRNKEARERMVQVLDETEKLGKSNISEICCDY
ncbi:hypothetical protein VTK26DRAFT_3753 [Humicola hyalothermophila]